jgi:hypothetical protein
MASAQKSRSAGPSPPAGGSPTVSTTHATVRSCNARQCSRVGVSSSPAWLGLGVGAGCRGWGQGWGQGWVSGLGVGAGCRGWVSGLGVGAGCRGWVSGLGVGQRRLCRCEERAAELLAVEQQP